jgi:hypothetical protein
MHFIRCAHDGAFLFGFAFDWIAYPFVRRAVDQRTSFAALMMVLFHLRLRSKLSFRLAVK